MPPLDDELHGLLAKLALPGDRDAVASEVCRHLGAEALFVLVQDPGSDRVVPAPGFLQTLPRGPEWDAFVLACVRAGVHRAAIPRPTADRRCPASGLVVDGGSVFVLVGEGPATALFDDPILPVLGRLFGAEHASATARDSRQLLETVVNHLPAGVLIVEADTRRVLFANAQVEQILGYPPFANQVAPGSRAFLAVHAGGTAFAIEEYPLVRALEGEFVTQEEMEIVQTDGARRVVSVTASPVRDANGRMLAAVASLTDVTERKVVEEERRRLLFDSEAANRSKDEFLAMLGHELRNPLAPIVTALQLIKQRNGSDRAHDVIDRQVKHLTRLVDDLLDVSRITRGKVRIKRKPIDLSAAIAKAVEMASPLLEQRRHRFSVTVPPTGMRMNGDEDRLAQVISNLLTNAARYTQPGGEITVTAERTFDELVLSVRDNGMGIDPEMLPRIFDLFIQGKRGMDRAEGGLGLGLALVKNLVAMHGGTVTAHSAGRDRGSEFVVCLPALPMDGATRAPAPAPAQPPAAPVHAPRRVLVVDDNVDAAELLSEFLSGHGDHVSTAHDGPTALDLAARFHPEVAVLDIGLPVMDGYELAQRLRALVGARRMRLIALTGYGQDADRAKTHAAGFDVHLVKPVDLGKLLDAIARAH